MGANVLNGSVSDKPMTVHASNPAGVGDIISKVLKPDSLVSGDKYLNIISNVTYTLYQTPTNSQWYVSSKFGKGEPCSEDEMMKFLASKFKKLESEEG